MKVAIGATGPKISSRRRADPAGTSARARSGSSTWETLNAAWFEVDRFKSPRLSRLRAGELVETVRRAVLAFDGSAHRTMLRDGALWFLELGSALERADNTARLLDVKYHLLLPRDEAVGGSLDYF